MSQALYRKYRSKSLGEILGQDHITSILSRAIERGKIAHAYLLTGPRGVGKTSIARILAHEINRLPYTDESTHLDIIEIDAASNNGVDDIRNLREKAHIAPTSAPKKVYIIDEVHMLSKPAFNALLKILEEPPEHVVFILATTDADKLPATIISRVQQFYFRPIPQSVIADHLQNIAKKEGFEITQDAAMLIAQQSRGGFRDAISLLDQLSPLGADETIDVRHVRKHLGLSGEDVLRGLLDDYRNHNSAGIMETLTELEDEGADAVIITTQLLDILRKELCNHPEYIDLMRELIEVTRHPHPDLKLLTILNAHATHNTQNEQTPKGEESKKQKKSTPTIASRVDAEEKPAQKPKKKTTKPTARHAELDWNFILEQAKADSLGLHSFLVQCDYKQEGLKLIIYAGKSFAAKKLDDVKYRSILNKIVASVNQDTEIEIIGAPKPPEDENLAKVAELMGGGEEIALEDV